MSSLNRLAIWILVLCIFINLSNRCFAENFEPFLGEVNTESINLRSDSTVNSEIICKLHKADKLEVILELYGWYKVKLPKNAPVYIKKNLVAASGQNITIGTALVLKDNVNIRLRPSETAPIIGRANKDEQIKILEDNGDWYKIEPAANSFGWVHKRFVNKVIN